MTQLAAHTQSGEQDALTDLTGGLRTMADHVKQRSGRPSAEGTAVAMRLISQLLGVGYSPRELGLSLRQLGLNPKARRYP